MRSHKSDVLINVGFTNILTHDCHGPNKSCDGDENVSNTHTCALTFSIARRINALDVVKVQIYRHL